MLPKICAKHNQKLHFRKIFAKLWLNLWLNEFLSHKFIVPGAKKFTVKGHVGWPHQVTSSRLILGYESVGINNIFRNETLSEYSYWKFYEEFASKKIVAMYVGKGSKKYANKTLWAIWKLISSVSSICAVTQKSLRFLKNLDISWAV